ncbi:hypothetical protein LZ31DRAFT_315935 [Colletotrichum somersetense]|nr:hypothetical protein LZ31DRAFT_315935 [Colletotrichum somersetense]
MPSDQTLHSVTTRKHRAEKECLLTMTKRPSWRRPVSPCAQTHVGHAHRGRAQVHRATHIPTPTPSRSVPHARVPLLPPTGSKSSQGIAANSLARSLIRVPLPASSDELQGQRVNLFPLPPGRTLLPLRVTGDK